MTPQDGRDGHRCAEPDQVPRERRCARTSSASRAARSSRRTTPSSTAGSGTSWCATSRAPATRPRGTPWPPARSASAWPPAVPVPPTWSRRSPTPTWTRSRWSRSPARSAAASIGTDAFQEADIRGITMPITKHNFLVTDPAEIPRVVAEAFYIASTGRPGPGARRRGQVGAAGADDVQLADRAEPARLPPGDPAALQADPRGDPADAGVAQAGALRRRRRDPRPRQQGAAPRWPS